jgi:hypothetical protein
MKYQIQPLVKKTEKVIQSCKTLDQLAVAIKFKRKANEQLPDDEVCSLYGYLICKAHSLGFVEDW